MVTTKEQLKKRIIAHLKGLVSETASVEEFSFSNICRAAKSNKDLVTEALNELVADERLGSHTIQMEVYIPLGKDGQTILETMAERGFLTNSIYLPVFACLAAFYFAIGYYPYTLTPGQNVTTLNGAYLLGIKNGILYSGLGVVGGAVLQLVLNKFEQWKILSVRAYERVAKVSKLSTVVFIALMVGYWVISWWTLRIIDPTMVVALLGISVTIAFGIEGQLLVKKPRRRRT